MLEDQKVDFWREAEEGRFVAAVAKISVPVNVRIEASPGSTSQQHMDDVGMLPLIAMCRMLWKR